MTNTYTSSKTTKTASPCGCGCGSHGTTKTTDCCGLNCFERPRYFCGHLLTDDDLSLEQRYMLEKNRLRNRELHGKGIVCGLRISCDPNCCGHVVIGDGYAIDDCGNDLVVCSPYSYDVIGALPQAGTAQVDCNDPAKRDDKCPTKQCFYLAACYYEEESDYTTPFTTGCNSTPGTCEPTRVHEKVRFQLLEELPENKSYLDQVEARMKECWAPFTKGRFAEVITGYYSSSVGNVEGNNSGNYDRFCQLQALFALQLRKRPSMQNCSLEAQVKALECPKDSQNDPAAERTAFSNLLNLVHQYVYDCMLGQLAFDCKSPCTPCCVILGSVEIEDGKIVRVCNCEREYVWSFANFIEVLLFTILQGGACHQPENSLSTQAGAAAQTHCCPSFTVDSNQFGGLYQLDPRVREYSGQTFMTAIRSVKEALQKSYQFTAQGVMSPKLFEQKPLQNVQGLAKQLGLGFLQEFRGTPAPTDLLSTFQSSTLIQPGEGLLVYTDVNGVINSVAPAPSSSYYTGGGVGFDKAPVDDLNKQMEALKASHAELSAKLAELQEAVKKAAPPEGGNPEAPHGGG